MKDGEVITIRDERPEYSYTFPEPIGEIQGKSFQDIVIKAIEKLCVIINNQSIPG